jgi:hypothetical protein
MTVLAGTSEIEGVNILLLATFDSPLPTCQAPSFGPFPRTLLTGLGSFRRIEGCVVFSSCIRVVLLLIVRRSSHHETTFMELCSWLCSFGQDALFRGQTLRSNSSNNGRIGFLSSMVRFAGTAFLDVRRSLVVNKV